MTKPPVNPTGAPVLSCDLDDHCVHVDCEADLPELPESLVHNPQVPDYVAHYCGLDYLANKRPADAQAGEAPEDKPQP
ncbi:MAG: hypothetical protein NZ524_06865 [Thiobacillaceae bacterium]|nr:hypothetical protein [Thiobacillaceae bacterium]MDW8322732.1 hypothetical protein [Burkholderiales bacterium]